MQRRRSKASAARRSEGKAASSGRGRHSAKAGPAKRAPVRAFGGVLLAALALVTVSSVGCARKTEPAAEATAPAPIAAETAPDRAITRLHPSEAVRGTAFNRQPDGTSAIAVEGAGFVRGDQVHWGSEPLETVFGSETALTAQVPKELIDRVGDVTISVRNPADPQSREVRATFRVVAAGPGEAE